MFDAATIGMTKLISDFLHGVLDLLGDLLRDVTGRLEALIRETLGVFDFSFHAGIDSPGVQEGSLLQTSCAFRDHSSFPSATVEVGMPILVVRRLEHGALLLLRGRLAFWDYELISQRTRPLGAL